MVRAPIRADAVEGLPARRPAAQGGCAGGCGDLWRAVEREVHYVRARLAVVLGILTIGGLIVAARRW